MLTIILAIFALVALWSYGNFIYESHQCVKQHKQKELHFKRYGKRVQPPVNLPRGRRLGSRSTNQSLLKTAK